ncbi:coiled-coil domain-containing protein 180-like [Haliotis cracherodii]|uniref:coiled-coil domain-containing protein 180-like n=1 Tax=Haliotis cracherodii TaxID=6455 RepID=UPI0039EC452E
MPTDLNMAETRAIRVVPSGKVYRQMFDAQVQLNKSLSSVQRKERLPHPPGEGTGIPTVHLSRDETQHGILAERQKTWVESFPNDPHMENPVLYKQFTEFVNARRKETDGNLASKEVRGLPDVVVPAKEESDIIQRISASRKERHEAAVEDMHQELSVISAELEPRVLELSDMTLRRLEDDDGEIAKLLSTIEKDEDLKLFSLEDLFRLWEDVQHHTPVRQTWITELDHKLQNIEDHRMDMIQSVFQSYSKNLEKIAHLMSPDLQRFMDKESQMINQTMLSNKRAYADLNVRLLSSDIEREKMQHSTWRRRVEDWKKLNTDLAVAEFKEYMNSGAVTNPPGVEKVFEFMVAEQAIMSAKRLELIESIGEMQPPSCTKTAVYKWNQQLQIVTQEIDAVNQMHMSKLHEEYESVCQTCLDHVESVKKSLIASGVCTEAKAQQVIEAQMLPLVGDQQRVLESNLETMEKAMENHNIKIEEKTKSLFKFTQGAAHVWDVHEIGLAKQERALQEKLEACRHQHDNHNQEREANLDIVMDRMRQDASEDSLRVSLAKSLEMLERIRLSYEIFHNQQTDIVKSYPEQVTTELGNYDQAVLKFYGVDRSHPKDKDSTSRESSFLQPDDKKEDSDLSTPKSKKKKKIAAKDDMAEEKVKPSSSQLPLAVSEVLSTERGTTFYVLTVAGEHGIPQDSPRSVPGTPTKRSVPATPPKRLLTPAFMTEEPMVDDNMPEYIKSVDIPSSLLIEVRKKVRMNFLNHLEDWMTQAAERASSVVVAKCEELNSELDLRLHLHQPRARRAEFDVHNVRAAELVMHSERVARHCKGIQQTLAELRHRFNGMSHEHNKLAQKFREDIEALEIIFINATKSSRLVALQNQLSVELDKFMSVIRTSLRKFRQYLDETLQMLRESNARFIKSFKVFSDGGNFCPDEIEEYRKKLEKMSQKIDTSEGSIMSDLEGMESKRLEQATKVAIEFEDRFKSHMFDLIFMEKIARWLTNTQVKIKAEVANSNSQAQRLMQHLNDLDRRIDACEKPNLDKEQITSSQLNDSLKALLEAFHARCVYLNCMKEGPARPQSASLQGNPATGFARKRRRSCNLSFATSARIVSFAARVGFSYDVTAVSKPGKQPSEDPSVGVIKSILKSQKNKMRFGMDAELDGDTMTPSTTMLPTSTSITQDLARDKQKSSMSQSSNKLSNIGEKKAGSRRGTLGSIVMDLNVPVKRVHSGLRRSSKSNKFDKKYLVFGEKEEVIELTNIMDIIRHMLREALDGLLTTADLYYRQKGNRVVTRPQALQETFEQCADTLVQKLQSYFKQAAEYHNQCLQELRSQLEQLEESISHVPGLVISDIVKEEIQVAEDAHTEREGQFLDKLDSITKRQVEHQKQLRPALGHPHQVAALQALCEKEAARNADYLAAVQEQTADLQACAVEHGRQFLERLAGMGERQLLQFDNLLVVDDVEKGKVEATRHPTNELIRRKNAGQSLFDTEDKNALPRGKGIWTGLPSNELVVGPKPTKAEKTASVTTAKTTLGHSATIAARDQAYKEYKAKFEHTLVLIEAEKARLLRAEQRWVDSWNMSVEKVKQLY